MNALALVRELEERGVRFELAADGRVIVNAPKGALDVKAVQRLRKLKSAIVTALRGQSAALDPPTAIRGADQRIPPQVVAEIRRVEAYAYRFGWCRARLWNCNFWPHTSDEPRGLASVIESGDHAIAVTADCITIEKSDHRRTRQTFWRTDA